MNGMHQYVEKRITNYSYFVFWSLYVI